MKQYDFTEQKIYEIMLYMAYCHHFELDDKIKNCETHESFVSFVKGATKHFGDCTKDPCSCERCTLNQIEIMAQNMTDNLLKTGIGWCGKTCLTECNGAYKTKEEKDGNKQ